MKPKVSGEHGDTGGNGTSGNGNSGNGHTGNGHGGGSGGTASSPGTVPGGGACRPGDRECDALPGPAGGGGGAGGLGPEAGSGGAGVQEPLVPVLPTAAPSGEAVVPPPLTAPEQAGPPDGATQMTLTSPASTSDRNAADWAVVVGIALVAEIGLLWGIACIGLWRRRVALYRAAAEAAAHPGGSLM